MYNYGSFGVRQLEAVVPVSSYELSPPFIIFANESQWKDSEGKLFKHALFRGNSEATVNFYLLANHLQVHFLRGTRQNLADRHTGISLADLRYFSALSIDDERCFPNLHSIKESDVDLFWNWFGQVFRLIRHIPNLCKLWTSGLISFMSRSEAEASLRKLSSGHFLIRFSETVAKGVVISSLQGSHVEHWLVEGKDKIAVTEKLFAILQSDDRFETILVMNKQFLSSAHPYLLHSKKSEFGQYFRTESRSDQDSKRYRRA